MGHAATASNSGAEAWGAREFSAFLRLRQGGSARATWLVEEAPGGTMISVGTDAACDWQIRAAFVPPRAFSVLVVGGRAFLRSGPEPGLLLDGKPVDDSWNPLPSNARIDMGLARFEIATGYADMFGDEPVLELSHRRQAFEDVGEPSGVRDVSELRAHEEEALAQTAVVQRQQAVRTSERARQRSPQETQEYRWPNTDQGRGQVRVLRDEPAQPMVTRPAVTRPAAKVRNSTIELRLEELDYAGTIPMARPTGEYAVSPTLLGGDEITRVTGRSGGMRWVAMGTLFAGAYGAWLYLLDRL